MTQDLIHKISPHLSTGTVLSFAPGRINLIGEHTDYNLGFVFPAAIQMGVLCAIRKSDKGYCTATSLDYKEAFSFNLDTIQPIPNGNWKNYVLGVISELQKITGELTNFEITITGNIPHGAGLSSSAALENSLVLGLNNLFNLHLSKEEMISISQRAEHNFVGVQCGIMDQYASMFGKKDVALFLDCNSLNAEPVSLQLKDHALLLINSNVKHSLADSEYNLRRKACEKISELLQVESLRNTSCTQLESIRHMISEQDYQMALYVLQENERTLKAKEVIRNSDLVLLGKLLYESHEGLKTQYSVSCEELDFLVDHSQEKAEILGARMMGGGFGGCVLHLIKKELIPSYKQEIAMIYEQKFKKKCTFYEVQLSEGAHIIDND